MKARLDPDRTAKPLTRLVARLPENVRFMGEATHYEAADGQRTPLTEPTKRTAHSPLLSAVLSALRAIGNDGGARVDGDGRVWLGDWFAEEESAGEVWVRRRGGNPYMVRPSRKRAASVLVREWVREQLDAWVQDDGDGE